MCEWLWFGILESYAIKWFMRLTGIQLAEVICIFQTNDELFSNLG